ncbi:hypothetical protein [Solirubrobacter soli]|uniref:hypothetical protein n=1 Tax=Solirubrobacter soli TaxID=363832 RepID=UPI0012F7F5F9|nr:hypothetical protein [Solirubrobacter soli]
MRVLVVALLLLAALPAAARADTFVATADSPPDASLPPGQDFTKVESSVDDVAGTWAVAVTLRDVPDADGSAAINATLDATAPDGGCGDTFGFLRASTDPANTAAMGSVLPPTGLRAAQSISRTADGATLTYVMTDTALVGLRPGCLTLTLSKFGFKDQVDDVPFTGPKQPPVVVPTPTPTPTPAPLTVRFSHPTARLHASSTGVVTITLAPFGRAASGTVTVKRGGKIAGRANYSAKVGAAVKVPIRLNATTRRSLARGRTLAVKVVATAGAATDTISTTVQRTRTRTRGE